jgi:hypothetical protein
MGGGTDNKSYPNVNVITVSCETQCVTIMADTDINAVRKQKKAEYDKQYRLKHKLLMQQHASTS